jgi:hypothetical protein
VEKNQYELCIKVLRRLNSAHVLKNIILIGSWCTPFYKEYFADVKYLPSIRTRDIDFLVPAPTKIKRKVDIPELLKDLGFIIGFKGPEGYIRLEHPQLAIEFLVPEKGKGSNKPYPLSQLGLNAQALRFLSFLTQKTIHIKVEDILVTLPHPAIFSLHKLIVFQRREKKDKINKDKQAAIEILKALINKGESSVIKNIFKTVPLKWQKRIIVGLKTMEEHDILGALK